MVLWLGLRAFTAEGTGSIPGWGTKVPQAAWYGQREKKKLSVPSKFKLAQLYIIRGDGAAKGRQLLSARHPVQSSMDFTSFNIYTKE